MDQLQLIQDCKRGKRRAQHQLYTSYAKAMFNVILRFVPNRADAEDLLQESFVKAFKSIDRFDGQKSFGAWLKRIVINTAISELRRRKIEWVTFDQQNHDISEAPSPASEITPEQLHHAIKELPDGARTVFSLYQIEGYKHREIAEMLEVSESTSKAQYVRAKKLLKESLKHIQYAS